MITRILNSRLPLMILTPIKGFDVKYFNAIHTSGALPVFDTEFMTREDILDKAAQLSKEDIHFGLRLSAPDQTLIQDLKEARYTNLDLLTIAISKEDKAVDVSGMGHTKLALELIDIHMEEAIAAMDPHVLILKGNEAAGRVSRYSSFIMMQWYLENQDRPVFVQGGVGQYTGAGMLAAGASGFVMDSQFWLADEAPISKDLKQLMAQLDESDSTEVSLGEDILYRVFAKLGTLTVRKLKQYAVELTGNDQGPEKLYQRICEEVKALDDADAKFIQSLFFLGQDGIFAKNFARKTTVLSEMVGNFFTLMGEHLALVDEHDPVVAESRFAKDQNTRLPLIQGPMANVSDNADFAAQVLEAGALPFFAVGSLPPSLANTMIKDGKEKLDNFGAGLVGIEAFNPAVEKHLAMVEEEKVPYALFAGGIPSQVRRLEKAGTKTYLHTPSVSMMENALENGCFRFIFEGGEAGGHVGNLSSMVLWEAAIDTLINQDRDLSELYLVFAGGISTCYSAFFISGMASFLAARGARIGLQVGTAYLFAKEMVETESIKAQYQNILLKHDDTMVIGKTLGLASRTAPTAFAHRMKDLEDQMARDKMPLDQRKRAFEKENIGSLLIGAKGFLPDFKRPGEQYFTWFENEDHLEKGNFLVGDSLAFFKEPVDIAAIHDTYFSQRARLYKNLDQLEIFSSADNRIHDEIAIVGMGCTLPDADNPEQLWENILGKKYSISEMDEDRFDRELYYNPDRSAEDSSYTILAGQAKQFSFDAEKFGYTPEKAKRLSRSQQLVLQTAQQAVESGGLLAEDGTLACDDPKRTAVIIATCLGNELGNSLQLKYWYPEMLSMLEKTPAFAALTDDEKETVKQTLLEGMEGDNPGYDPVHGMLLNIEASRVAKHLGAKGTNFIVDAACASSFTAIEAGMGELLSGDHDQVVVGGVNTHLAPESFIGFAKMGTLSAKGSYPFDQRADGFILGEGSAVFVLKRMKDALRDGNKIFGVINAVGGSSDGKGKAIAAPNPNGQVMALERCFENMHKDVSPASVGFIEAHGTSTIVGDQVELGTLKAVYEGTKVGVSSIKSQVGHLLGGAGSAGMIKALLAINKGVLPPNGQFETLGKNHDLDGSTLFVVKDEQKWEVPTGTPRRAGISSYGFGGINYHIVVEEMTDAYVRVNRQIFADTAYDFNDDRIVVAGLGVMLPGAKNTEEFWEKLVSGEKQFSPVSDEHFDNDAYAAFPPQSFYHLPKVNVGLVKDYKFNNLKYRMPPKMVSSIERGQIFGLEAAGEALESAGLLNNAEANARTGVILGTIAGERQSRNIIRVRKQLLANILAKTKGIKEETAKQLGQELADAIRAAIPENNEDTTPGLLSNIISGRIANFYGLNGPNYVLDASCASSTIAVRNAMRSLRHKELDYVLAGGVDCNLYPAVIMAFKRLGLLSAGEATFFDNKADGYSMGEGAAIHMLTTYGKAMENKMTILGEINECVFSSSVTDHLLAPSEQTFNTVIEETYKRSGIRKNDIQHMDVFAFSNIFGDMVEKQVIERSFDHEMSCGNVKAQFGYFKAANPAVALAKLMLMNAKGKLLPYHHYNKETSILNDSKVLKPVFELTDKPKDRPFRFAANVNGIGGNHAHMIVGELPPVLDPAVQSAARKAEALEKIAAHKRNQQPLAAAPVSAVAMSETPYSADERGKKLRMIALLSGQGAQRPGMMKDLYDNDVHIRSIMDRGEAVFKEKRGYSLLDIMFGKDEALNSTQNTQPAVFLSSAALCSRLALEGFAPDYFIGHSVGEYTALFCSGILDFEDAMGLIIKRSDLMFESTLKQPGKIMVVFKNEKETAALIRESFISDIYITNKNSEKQTAVSGKADAIEQFCRFLTTQGAVFKKLNLTGAFHTPLLDEAAAQLRTYLDTLNFKKASPARIISNTLAAPYPENTEEIKDLLARQIVSPVEFIKSVESVYVSGKTEFIEIGPTRLLSNLLKNINIGEYGNAVTVDARKGEAASFEECRQYLLERNALFETPAAPVAAPVEVAAPMAEALPAAAPVAQVPAVIETPAVSADLAQDFEAFKADHQDAVDKILFQEFKRQQRDAAIDALNRYDFNTRDILISGVSVGLPGKARRVFAKDNFDAILNGENFIEPLSLEIQETITDKNITKLYKAPDGNARFIQITKTEDVLHLAGQLGFFDLGDEYGIKTQYDTAMALGIAAGLEALKDANIPLVMQYKKMKDGRTMIPDGFALPKEMQEDTGVIITSLWPNSETLIDEMEKYFYEKLFLKPHEEFEKIYYFLMEKVKDIDIKEAVTEWFFKAKSQKRADFEGYKFDRNFLSNACPLGSAHLAQIIKAKGPNTLVSSACASTTLAVGIAEDWIRVGRCKRVLVVGGEIATSERQAQWVGTGFLALGAATIKKRVSEAAKPFDEDRNGTILGSGAVGLIIEDQKAVARRGMNGQCKILGTHMANSAFHTYNIDVPHMASEMNRFINIVEKRHGLKKEDYASKLLFMSHETYTPARGGSADAEVTALKTTFAEHLNSICISNTKGFTGHTLGAAIEDVVLVKALQKRKAPPIANLRKIPEHFKDLNFSGQDKIDSEYGLHLSAGFGSHFAYMFVQRVEENPVEGNVIYANWLKEISGSDSPELKIIDNTLCVVASDHETPVPPKTDKTPKTIPAPAAPAAPVAAAPAPVATAPALDPLPRVKAIVAEQTGYTVDMLEDDLDLEADLGIDTVKQVEIFGKIASDFGFAVPDDLKLRELNTIEKLGGFITQKTGAVAAVAAPAAPATPAPQAAPAPAAEAPTAAGLTDTLDRVKAIVAEQTGYTVDMLEDDLDLEADLGIDTVKQVEIFGKVASDFGFAVPDDLKLRELNTIEKLGAFIANKAGLPSTPAAALAAASAPAVTQTAAAVETPAAAPAATDALDSVKDIISEQTGYTADMLEDDLDLEADLGIDTVKQVEIFAKVAAHFNFAVPEDLKLRDLNTIAKLSDYVASQSGAVAPAPVAEAGAPVPAAPAPAAPATAGSSVASADQVLDTVKDIIADQTGYTVDMLETDLDLEADLGIDTVKQVEIFAKVAARFNFAVPEDLKLRDLNTIAKLAQYIADQIGGDDTPDGSGTGTPAPATETAPAAAPAVDALDTVKAIIEEQTGYTADMLEADLDLEADLGIDTVKQVEIFAKVAARFNFAVPEDLKLRDLNTIAKLSDYIQERAAAAAPAPAETAVPAAAAEVATVAVAEVVEADDIFPDPESPIKRLVVRMEEAPMPGKGRKDLKGQTFLVSLDSHGFARALAKKVKKMGGKVMTMGTAKVAKAQKLKLDLEVNLADFAGTTQTFEKLAAENPAITGFIHLASLDYYFNRKNAGFASDEEVNTTMKSVFSLVKHLYQILDKEDTFMGTVAFDSVVFPYGPDCGEIHPAFGALTGLLKTVNKELEKTRVKVVDFAYKQPKKNMDRILDLFLAELLSDDARCEVGYGNKKRYVLSMQQSIAMQDQAVLTPGDTLLVSGGAGGITFEILKQVVKTHGVNLAILGRADLAGLDPKFANPATSQAELMALLKADMPGEKPVAIKRALDRVIRTRQAIENLAALKALGTQVTYFSADVTDAHAVAKAVAEVGRIDGVLHAAGVEMSQFIPKKEDWAFDLVTDVKIKGLVNLMSAVDVKACKCLMAFSSVTARFGNEGQVDYTAANDFLGKALLRQKQLHPELVTKVYAWTAWSGTGMATNPTVKKVLEERGLQFLPLDQGVRFFMADLLDAGETELVISGMDYAFDTDGLLGDPVDKAFPFLDDIRVQTRDEATWSRLLELKRDLFLHDHTMGDVPLFLGATGIESMAEAAIALAGDDSRVVELSNFSIPYGIKLLKGREKEILISSKKAGDSTYDCRIDSVFKNPAGKVMGDPKQHYQGRFELAKKAPKGKTIELPEFSPIQHEGELMDQVYHPARLFMFGLFGTITDVNSFDGTTLVTTVEDISDAEFFKGAKDPKFAAAPVLVDAMFQTGGLLEFFTSSQTVLPFNIDSMTFYKDVERKVPYHCITTKLSDGEETNTYRLQLVDKKGNVYIEVSRFQMVKLHTLDPKDQIAHKVTFKPKAEVNA